MPKASRDRSLGTFAKNMTPEDAAFRGILTGSILTLAGTLLTSVVGIITQRLQTRWTFETEKKKDLYQKRLVALQNCVQLTDFLMASKNSSLSPRGVDLWAQIRVQNVCNGAFFPKELQYEFEKVIQCCLLLDDPSQPVEVLSYQVLSRLRRNCLDYIQKEF